MYHYVLQSADGEPLFATWEEGLWLWWAIVTRIPGVIACFVMPDHVHVLIDRDVHRELSIAMRAWARWRNRRRGTSGRVWRALAAPIVVPRDKRSRVDRYIHLNGCRGGLATDPLGWPLSTYRDALGLTLRPVRGRVRDPYTYHRYVSGDPTVAVAGTTLPAPQPLERRHTDLAAVAAAVSSTLRVPARQLRERGPARTLFVRAARSLTLASTDAIGAHCALSRRAVQDVPAAGDADVLLVGRVLGDPRFFALADHDLTRTATWARWARRRRPPRT